GSFITSVPIAASYLARRLGRARSGGMLQLLGFRLVFQLDEVGYIEEGIPLQAKIYECRLHAGQDAGDTPVVNRPGQGVFIFTLVVNLCELVVFKNCKPRFVRRAGYTNLFCHRTFPPGRRSVPGSAAGVDENAVCGQEWGVQGEMNDTPPHTGQPQRAAMRDACPELR